jgi:hypothetical protein
MRSEPVITVSMVTALVTALFGVLVAFNIHITPEQQAAILALITAICVIIIGSGFFARNFVWSADSVAKLTGQKDPVVR